MIIVNNKMKRYPFWIYAYFENPSSESGDMARNLLRIGAFSMPVKMTAIIAENATSAMSNKRKTGRTYWLTKIAECKLAKGRYPCLQ